MMATHPATMVSNVILLQLIHIGGGLRTGLYPDTSIIFPLWGKLSNDKWCTPSKSLGSPGIDESP